MAPSDLREQLNDLWKTTVDQFDEIKEVVVHNSYVGRKKLDAAFLKRQRDRLFQDLGELMFVAAAKGDLPLSAEALRVVERIKDVAARLKAEERELEDMRGPVVKPPAPQADENKEQVKAKADVDVEAAKAAPSAKDPVAKADDLSAEPKPEKSEKAESKEAKAEAKPAADEAKQSAAKVTKKAPPKKKSTKAKTTLDAQAEDGHKPAAVDDEEQKPKRRQRRPRKKAEPKEN